jgi:transposase
VDHRQSVGQDHGTRGIRGFNAHKQIKGRKRHLLVDPVGLLLAVVFTAASMQDRDGAKNLLAILQHKCSRLRLIWADQAYAGQLVPWVKALRRHRPIRLDIGKRSKGTNGVEVSPKRWIVERTRGWFNRYRRLSKDYELLPQTREAIVRVVIIHLMMRRLARTPPF